MSGNPFDDILSWLDDDLVSHGLVEQACRPTSANGVASADTIDRVIEALLTTGRVVIGTARLASPTHVEFIGWNGAVSDRVQRAREAVSKALPEEREFAYWLCLRKNVDRFEDGT